MICQARLARLRFRAGHTGIAATCSCSICRSVLPDNLRRRPGILLYSNPENLRYPNSNEGLEIRIDPKHYKSIVADGKQWNIALKAYQVDLKTRDPRQVLARLLNVSLYIHTDRQTDTSIIFISSNPDHRRQAGSTWNNLSRTGNISVMLSLQ